MDLSNDRPLLILRPERCAHALTMAFAPDGELLATGGMDSSITVQSLHTGKGADNPVGLWNLHTGAQLRYLSGHHVGVTAIAFSPDGKTVASGGIDKLVRLWDTLTGQVKQTLEHEFPVGFVAYSPDGQFVASTAGRARLWDPHTGQLKRTMELYPDESALPVAFSPDSRLLATGTIAGMGPRGDVILWDVHTGKVRQRLAGYSGGVGSVVFSPDGMTLASTGGGGEDTFEFSVGASLWDVETGRLKQTVPGGRRTMLPLAFRPDGSVLVADGQTVQMWDTSTRRLDSLRVPVGDCVGSAAVSPDGKTLATGCEGIVKLWRLD